MFDSKYIPVDEELEFNSIEEAIMTCCPYCSTPFEWTIIVKYNCLLDRPELSGSSTSCGESFSISPFYDKDGKFCCYKVFEIRESE